MINYPVGSNGLYSPYQQQSPIIGSSLAMDFIPGMPGTNSLATDMVQVPGLNGIGTSTLGTGTSASASTTQILSMLVTLIQTLIQSLTQQGKSNQNAHAFDLAPDQATKDTTNTQEAPAPPTNAKANVSDGFIDTDTKQQGQGDCVFLSVTRSIGQTDQGRTAIHNAITPNKDGSFEVKFAGSDKSYHVTADEAKKQGQWANGDIDMQILGSAADKYFKDHGQSSGVNGQSFTSISKLITGDSNHSVAYTGRNSVDEIKKALIDAAPDIGKTKSIAISGGVDGSNWKAENTSHEYAVESIDTKTGMITYTNPWDTSVKRTISIDAMAKQLVAHPNGSTIDIFGAK